MKIKVPGMLLVSFFLLGSVCASDTEQVELGEILITPQSNIESTSLYSTPYSAKVLTKADIKQRGVTTLIDLLEKESSVNVSDWYGTGIKANVDLMGFGDNALSNLLVLVNGRRVNDIDMSGVDWVQVPLQNIEKIEIIKGGGVVLYGDNANGGVINIITQHPQEGPPEIELNLEGASYSTHKEVVSLKGGKEILSFYLYSDYYSTNGYRVNSHYRSRYTNLNFHSQVSPTLQISCEGGMHDYVTGLPGDLTEADFAAGLTRRDSNEDKNNTQMEESYLHLSVHNEFNDSVKAAVDISYRNKNGIDNWLNWPGWESSIDKDIHTLMCKPQLFINTDFFGMANAFIGGGEFFQSDFSAFNDDYSILDSDNFTDIDRGYEAVFLYDTLAITEKLSFNGGARLEKEKFTFDYESAFTTIDDQLDFKEEAYEIGVNYKLADKTNCFFQFARGFRIPKTDEYFNPFASPPVNKDLLPQTSKTVSLGANTRFANIGFTVDYFYTKLNNEIFLDPSIGPVGVNANYDKTERQGFNVSFELNPLQRLDIALGYRYTKAEFSGGAFEGKTIPMVPESKLNMSLSYTFMEYCSIFIDTVYRGKVFLVNDVNNVLDTLDSYWVTNLKIAYHKDEIELYAGVNNVCNEIYSEYASTNSTATVRGFYPSPERNYYWGVKYSF